MKRKNQYWKSLPLAIIIALAVSCISWPVGLGFLILFIIGCIGTDANINKEYELRQEGVNKIHAEFIENMKLMPQEERRSVIEGNLRRSRTPSNVKWQRDAFPDDVDAVLEKLHLIFDEKCWVVINTEEYETSPYRYIRDYSDRRKF